MFTSYLLGIDISKAHLDGCLLIDGKQPSHYHCSNTPAAIEQMLLTLPVPLSELLICAEHTARYGYPLQCVADQMKLNLWMEDPARIKLSGGFLRGKDDPQDALRIATYACRFSDRACCRVPVLPLIEHLECLVSERRLLVADRAKYKALLRDQHGYLPATVYQSKQPRLHQLIEVYSQQITDIEYQMEQLLATNESVYRLYSLLQTIPGVGKHLALYTLLTTRGFTRFSSARALCCYAGVAPFAYHSGVNTYTRKRVSHRADKVFKCLLHLGALAAVRQPGELHAYYHRKCAEGKAKMSVINAVRAKLLHRMWAVAHRQTPYYPAPMT